jgi:hypothetical protein
MLNAIEKAVDTNTVTSKGKEALFWSRSPIFSLLCWTIDTSTAGSVFTVMPVKHTQSHDQCRRERRTYTRGPTSGGLKVGKPTVNNECHSIGESLQVNVEKCELIL